MPEYQLPRRLHDARVDNDLSQQKLGDALGIAGQNIGKHEKGKAKMNTFQLYTSCLVLNASSDYLLGLDDRKMLCIDGLTREQEEIITRAVAEYQKANRRAKR